MPFDGAVVKSLVHELNNKIINGKIDKVYQTEKDEIILSIRSYKETNKLLISASSNYPRINLTNENKSNPQVPPSFCMLLRKHLIGAKVLSVTQPSLERVVEINLQCIDELGYSNQKSLIAEIMGRNSNIVFIDTNSSKIIDCIKHIDEDISSLREVLPGISYVYPPAQGKLNTLTITEDLFEKSIKETSSSISLEKFFVRVFFGISPSISREICYLANLDYDIDIKDLNTSQTKHLFSSFETIVMNLKTNTYHPTVFYKNNEIYDFSCFDLKTYSEYSGQYCLAISEVIELFYNERDKKDRLKQKTGDIRKVISNKLDRFYKKIEKQNNEITESQNSEKYKIYGDLLTSSLHLMNKGDKSIKVLNYYSEDQSYMEIPLDFQLSPSRNAQRYYRLYTKSKNALIMIKNQIEETNKEIYYLEAQLDNIEKCTDELEINEIRYELSEQGYLKKKKEKNQKHIKQSKPSSYLSSSGFEIYVGKNNYQNDFLTLKVASSNDIWLHTKEIPGSHVIIKTNGNAVDDITLQEAANIASFYSKGKLSSKVPVDYTYKKYVKKPSGAKPGMVIYENHKTIYITPDESIIKSMKKVSN